MQIIIKKIKAKHQIKHTKIQINTDIKTKKAKQIKQHTIKAKLILLHVYFILSLLIKNHTFKLIPDDGCVN